MSAPLAAGLEDLTWVFMFIIKQEHECKILFII